MCSTSKPAVSPDESELPCNLCGINVNSGTIGNGYRGNRSSLRGLVLCYGCNGELGGGAFSAPIVQSELRSMKLGGSFASRPPLPKNIRDCINGPAVEPPRINRQPAAELPPPPAESPVPPPTPVVEPRRPHVTRARKPRQLEPASSPATDWRTNGRAVLAAVHV
jgi:hypothetical protein